MNTSAQPSAPSPLNIALIASIAAAFVFYTLPWSTHSTSSLTFGAYDLAEWSSLHPAVRFVEPILQTPLLLRLPAALLLMAFALNVPSSRFSRAWWIAFAVVIVGAIALMPPLEFFSATDDPNYRQQALVATVALLGGLVGLSGTFARVALPLVILISGATLAIALIGFDAAYRLLIAFQVAPTLGIGVIGFGVAVLSILVFASLQIVAKQKRG